MPFCGRGEEVFEEDEGWEADVDDSVRKGSERRSREVWRRKKRERAVKRRRMGDDVRWDGGVRVRGMFAGGPSPALSDGKLMPLKSRKQKSGL